jgi:hypothetical protein
VGLAIDTAVDAAAGELDAYPGAALVGARSGSERARLGMGRWSGIQRFHVSVGSDVEIAVGGAEEVDVLGGRIGHISLIGRIAAAIEQSAPR